MAALPDSAREVVESGALANLVTLACHFFDDIGLRNTWMVLHVIAQLSSSVLESSLQLFFLIGAEV